MKADNNFRIHSIARALDHHSDDHRVIDCAVAADQFMGRVKQVLENWQEAVL